MTFFKGNLRDSDGGYYSSYVDERELTYKVWHNDDDNEGMYRVNFDYRDKDGEISVMEPLEALSLDDIADLLRLTPQMIEENYQQDVVV